MKVIEKYRILCSGKGFIKQLEKSTSVFLRGVLTAVGLQGKGQRSRHSGWVTTLQSWQRRYILPNFVLLPHGAQNSDLITLAIEKTECLS